MIESKQVAKVNLCHGLNDFYPQDMGSGITMLTPDAIWRILFVGGSVVAVCKVFEFGIVAQSEMSGAIRAETSKQGNGNVYQASQSKVNYIALLLLKIHALKVSWLIMAGDDLGHPGALQTNAQMRAKLYAELDEIVTGIVG